MTSSHNYGVNTLSLKGGNHDATRNYLEVLIYLAVLGMLVLSLQLLLRMARTQMQPRPKYVKPDPLFKDFGKGQNWSWDWVMVFAVRSPDDYVSDYQRRFTLRRVVERLESGGLETKLYKSYTYDKIFCKIRCSADRLKDQAAEVCYPLLLDETQVVARIEKGRKKPDGEWKWYPRRAGWLLTGENEDGEKVEREQDNAIVDTEGQSDYPYQRFIYGKFDKRPDLQHPSVYVTYPASNSIFRSVDRLKLIEGIMEADPKKRGCNLQLKELLARGACLAIYPLHDDDELQTIQDRWLTPCDPPWAQPIVMVKDYFGEKVGMYFLFLGTYSTWLFYAAGIGVASFGLELLGGQYLTWATAACGICMSLWTTLFLECWKGEEARAKLEWGMTGFEETEEDRTEFEGREIHSPVTGLPDAYFPPRDKVKRILGSYIQIVLCIFYVSCVNAGIFYVHAYVSRYPLRNYVDFHHLADGPFGVPTVVTNLALALLIQWTNALFMPFATRMTRVENHRTETDFEDQLIAKVFLFQFVNSNGALFYVAMAQGPLTRGIGAKQPWKTRRFDCAPYCLEHVSYLLGTIFIVRVVLGNWNEVVAPFLTRLRRDAARRRGHDEDDAEYEDPASSSIRKRQVSPAEEQFEKDDYGSLDIFDDYGELVVQFGYATLFVSAFPLAPVFACVNNFIEIRVDGWKMCQNTKRPWPKGAEDIGTWESVLTVVAILGTITNSIMITQTSPAFTNVTSSYRLVAFVVLEWILIGAKIVLMSVIDDVPEDVELQEQRQEFLVTKIIVDEADEEIDLEDDEFIEIDEPKVYQSDPCLREDAGGGDEDDGPGGEKKEADAEE